MKDIEYTLRKIAWRFLKRDREIVNDLFRRGGVKIGNNCKINCNILTSESFLISLGNNVTISDHVSFITHDNSISKVVTGISDLYGRISIGDNCFIGAHSIIMYGVTLADNIIVAAGSVVTKSFAESNVIVGGNPARVISTWERFKDKNQDKGISISSFAYEKRREILMNNDKLINR